MATLASLLVASFVIFAHARDRILATDAFPDAMPLRNQGKSGGSNEVREGMVNAGKHRQPLTQSGDPQQIHYLRPAGR